MLLVYFCSDSTWQIENYIVTWYGPTNIPWEQYLCYDDIWISYIIVKLPFLVVLIMLLVLATQHIVVSTYSITRGDLLTKVYLKSLATTGYGVWSAKEFLSSIYVHGLWRSASIGLYERLTDELIVFTPGHSHEHYARNLTLLEMRKACE